MNWLIFTLVAVSSRSIYSIATKILSNRIKVSAISQAVLLTTFAGLLSLPFSVFVGGISFAGISSVLLFVLLMVFSQAFGNILFFQGMNELDAGTAQIAFSSILIWGSVLSVAFLGSNFSLLQVFGIFIMLIAILLTQYQRKSINFNKGALLIIASAGLFSVFQVTSARISEVISTGAYLLMAYLGSSLILSFVYFNKIAKDLRYLLSKAKDVFKIMLFASGTSLLYFIFSYFAYRVAPDKGVVVVLLTAQVVLSVILGIILLKETRNLKRKLLAGILAFIASVLIKS